MYYFITNDPCLLISTNNGQSWASANFIPSTVTSLASIGGTVFAGTELQGIYSSTNQGTNWIRVNTGLTDSTITCLATLGGTLFTGTTSGVFVSTDNGTSWSATTLLNKYIISMTSIEQICLPRQGIAEYFNYEQWSKLDSCQYWSYLSVSHRYCLKWFSSVCLHKW